MVKLKEDTSAADRVSEVQFDPDGWKKGGGKTRIKKWRRISFNVDKFGGGGSRKKDAVDESIIQPSGSSKVEGGGPEQSDQIAKEVQKKKSNNPQIEFVTGTAMPNGSSSTSTGGAQATGRKIAEALVKKARAKVKKQTCNEEGTTMSKTYTEFMEELDQLVEFVVEENQLNEYNAKDGVYRHKGTYGGGYTDPEGADDADDKPKAAPAAPAVKRGRGRPSGSYGTYKARSAETKAAAAAKSAASKAANKAKAK